MQPTDTTLATTSPQSPAFYDHMATQPDAVTNLGKWIAHSGMLAETKLEQCYLIAFTCLAERMSPVEFFRTYDIVFGKLAKKTGRMLAEFRANHGGDFYWKDSGTDGKKATLVLIHRGREMEVTFTMADADRVGLPKKNDQWRVRPANMLRARCISEGLRMVCPEIAAGVYSPEEIADIGPTTTAPGIAMVADGPLTPLEIATLEAELHNLHDNATAFFRSKGWIKEGQTFRDVDGAKGRGMLANPAPVVERLHEFHAEAAKAAPAEEIEFEVLPVEGGAK